MTLIGHDAAWKQWRAGMASARMHHAWLLAGPRGVGKGVFARAAAMELVAEPGSAPFAAGAHPDILLLENLPESGEEAKKRDDGKPFKLKRNITVDQIRQMQARLTTRPTAGLRRAVIIDPADDLEKGAVNAILKSLEEPPQGTFFLLVVHQPGRLIATVRSRCRVLRFGRLSDEQIAKTLRRQVPDADDETLAAAVIAARGSPGAALDFVSRELGAVHGLMGRLLRSDDQDFALRGALATEIGTRPDRERLVAILELARTTLARELVGASRERQQRIISAHGELALLSAQAPTFNFDPGLLVMEIGGLLASVCMPTQAVGRTRPA